MDLHKDLHLQWTENMDGFRNQKRNSFMEAINWVCARTQHKHDWTSDFSSVLQESTMMAALSYDIDVRCEVQWGLLWYFAATT